MASTKISDETTASSLTGTELVPVVQSGSNRKTTTQDIADLASGGWGYTLVTATTATLADSNRIVEFDPASGATTLTLPTPSAGRTYIIRKIDGDDTKTITLARHASEKIDDVAASRTLPGSDTLVDITGYSMQYSAWMVTCDGTDWRTFIMSPQTRAVINKSSAPVDSSDALATGFYPGSFWHQISGDAGLCFLQTGNDAADGRWIRVDAVRVQSVTGNTTLDAKDTTVFVSTSGGAVTLTLPSPADDGAGRQFSITKTNTGTNKIVLARHGSESINGAASSLDPLPGSDDADYGRWHVVSDGTDWWVTGGSGLT